MASPGKSPRSAPRRARTGGAWFDVALVAIAVAAVYANTLGVPFYLDDPSIRDNPLV